MIFWLSFGIAFFEHFITKYASIKWTFNLKTYALKHQHVPHILFNLKTINLPATKVFQACSIKLYFSLTTVLQLARWQTFSLPARFKVTLKEQSMSRAPFHPGEHLADELREAGILAAELARQLDVPVNRVTAILKTPAWWWVITPGSQAWTTARRGMCR